MATAINWPTYQAFFATAADALTSGDYVGARRAALQAKMVALGLGASVSASGTSVQLLISEAGKLIDEITALAMQDAMKSTGGRLIRTGLKNEGRRYGGGDGGVRHDG